MLAVASPKESKGSLETLPNTFAVQNGVLYDYYSIKFGERRGDFVDIHKLPGVMKEGFVTYQKNLYRVSLKDYLRSKVNVGQSPYVPPSTLNDGGRELTAANKPTSNVGKLRIDSGQLGSLGDLDVQIEQAANLAFEDQIRALLYADNPEEEWLNQTAP